ncbi:DUF411 domain-containing protein [Roseitranquillus sediminis]|uniref:DUF411 domain-containing protein n=1 Tax=Roseitranquillus sediminis TaxID=2809051 RepID=UPI001D0CD854|nr:DUF411 domain-containing protein [Roseitranquillus sediminis]MBM9593419.1 DUF411 domain-containing protein [Roseitranquillus sediminis]
MTSSSTFSRRGLIIGAAAVPLLGAPLISHATELPLVSVSKDPSCGCCGAWVEHIESAGFPVSVVETTELDAVKRRLGVPPELASCHTAEVADYVVEGHVPAAAIQRLLSERPAATGLAVPGMPIGSPGMEVPGVESELFDVFLFRPTGHTTFAQFRGAEAL